MADVKDSTLAQRLKRAVAGFSAVAAVASTDLTATPAQAQHSMQPVNGGVQLPAQMSSRKAAQALAWSMGLAEQDLLFYHQTKGMNPEDVIKNTATPAANGKPSNEPQVRNWVVLNQAYGMICDSAMVLGTSNPQINPQSLAGAFAVQDRMAKARDAAFGGDQPAPRLHWLTKPATTGNELADTMYKGIFKLAEPLGTNDAGSTVRVSNLFAPGVDKTSIDTVMTLLGTSYAVKSGVPLVVDEKATPAQKARNQALQLELYGDKTPAHPGDAKFKAGFTNYFNDLAALKDLIAGNTRLKITGDLQQTVNLPQPEIRAKVNDLTTAMSQVDADVTQSAAYVREQQAQGRFGGPQSGAAPVQRHGMLDLQRGGRTGSTFAHG